LAFASKVMRLNENLDCTDVLQTRPILVDESPVLKRRGRTSLVSGFAQRADRPPFHVFSFYLNRKIWVPHPFRGFIAERVGNTRSYPAAAGPLSHRPQGRQLRSTVPSTPPLRRSPGRNPCATSHCR
jgi:hypothetical protein